MGFIRANPEYNIGKCEIWSSEMGFKHANRKYNNEKCDIVSSEMGSTFTQISNVISANARIHPWIWGIGHSNVRVCRDANASRII